MSGSCPFGPDKRPATLSDRPAHLVGLSYGGWVAMNQALRVPARVASITLLDPAGLTRLDARFWWWFTISGLASLTPMPLRRHLARWTGRALRIAWNLGDRDLLASVLRMHGNELRKAGHTVAGIVRIRQSLQIDDHPARKGSGLVLLGRAAADSGQAELFDAVAGQCVQALRSAPGHEVLFNTFTVREVRLRGLLATGRITTADVLARAGDEHAAAKMLSAAIGDSETLRLPHQVQRIIRLTAQPGVLTGQQPVRQQAQAALTRLDRQLADTTAPTSPSSGI